ncbi:hypothetical protein CPB84DRAFT_1715272 [Gymnopilus junonius]|uniref:Distal membrane-arm assembly complex protein 1-like domain-containing protein n=1 Tax=Gymnopilus junonius TaxID=109634 RepID=A0A9P5NCJ3_GYMJU|nr:hypothetical protein CPB84DRAFT_1715272 [Gymnopilus junonius]
MSEQTFESTNASQALSSPPRECLSCRIMGTGILAGTGSYAIWQSRAAATGTPLQKKMVATVGLALIIGSVFRWRGWK